MMSGFVTAQSDNLPKVDAFMMTVFFATNPDFTSAEVKGVKAARSERESYGDAAVGYVKLKREHDLCVVKAQITPEHNIHNKSYNVTAICNESEETIISVQCEDCPAHLGGCKHAIAFLAWLHRRSEDPPTTSVDCYWKKSKLSSVGTSLKFLKAQDICNVPKKKLEPKKPRTTVSFLSTLKNHSKAVGDMQNQIMKYYQEPSNVEKLSIHYLVGMMQSKPLNGQDFINFCKINMTQSSCVQAAIGTVDQSECPLWHELRYGRITASKAYEAAYCKVLDGSLTEAIMGATKLRETEAMKRGLLLENKVLQAIEEIKKIKISKCGLTLNPDCPIMGASPDGENDDYIIEIKCPSSENAMKRYITKDNKVSAKYMAQVQLQMHFCKRAKALFCVASFDFEATRNVNIIEVQYDKKFCDYIIQKCTFFWCYAIFPLLFK